MVLESFTFQRKLSLLQDIKHTYRALLRAAGYLPDATARAYIHSYIIHRFNPFNPLKLDRAKWGSNEFRDRIPVERTEQRLKKAKQALRSLQRAANGESADLKKVLMHAYGRSGKRRRELIVDLLQPGEDEIPKDDSALRALVEKRMHNLKDADNRATNPTVKALPTSKFGIFIKDQKETPSLPRTGKSKIRAVEPKIPATNSWGRSLPMKRIPNIEKKWLRETVEKILPPLPAHEWDRLRDVALGLESVDFPARRKKIEVAELDNDVDQLLGHIMTPPLRKTSVVLGNKEDGLLTLRPPDSISPRTQRKRSIRRLYAFLWGISPMMIQDPVSKQYTITWGRAEKLAEPSVKDLELFETDDDTDFARTEPKRKPRL